MFINNKNIILLCNFLLLLRINYYKPFNFTVMLVSYTKSHRIDANEFRNSFPCSVEVYRSTDLSFVVDLEKHDGTNMDVVSWYIDEFCGEYPQCIEFDYASAYNSITVVYINGCVTFTFFDYE